MDDAERSRSLIRTSSNQMSLPRGHPLQQTVSKKPMQAIGNSINSECAHDHWQSMPVHGPYDARAHEVLLCIGAGRMLDDPGRPRLDVDSFWFKPGEVMAEQLGPEYSEAIENTERLADRCNVTLSLGEVYLPTYQVPEAHTITSYLAHVTQVGLEERYAEFDAVGKVVDKDIYARLEEELGIIEGMGFPGYFLIVMDFIQWAKDHDIPVGPGRGSGAGSLVAYALKINDLDPIPYGLLFERFLNPERVSMPDFDIDFCMNRRGEVIDYVTEKYGTKNVGQIVSGSLKARVIKDVGPSSRVLIRKARPDLKDGARDLGHYS